MTEEIASVAGQRELSRSVVRWRLSLMPALPLAVLAAFVGAAIGAHLVTPYDPVAHNLINSLRPPAFMPGGVPEHVLGTDSFGRDVLSRLVYGAQASLVVATFALLIAVTIGTTAGVTAGYFGGVVEAVLMRLVDLILSLPVILVALTMAVALGPSFRNLVILLGLLIWPRIARLLRGETLLLKNQEFMRYARAIGVPGWLIVLRHVLPNIVPTLLVATTLEIGHVIFIEASLSFLGAGLPPPTPSWGLMINDGRALIATGWWIAMFPGLAITLAVLSLNMLGDWLRDTLDPKFSGLLR